MNTYTMLYVRLKRVVVAQRPTQIREIENGRININISKDE